ncbi:MAG: hypothetical protein HYW78_00230 [Parcubacteria group bacterium]|nr:hypothetical protein [Parcubacteria group bacterium]
MNKNSIIFIVIFIIIVVAVYVLTEPKELQNNSEEATNETENQITLDTRINDEGEVEIAATPRFLARNVVWFDIELNTHSVDISEELKNVSVARVDGKEYMPIAWEGDPPGGHHLSGVLKFNSFSPLPKKIELEIRKIGGIEKRIFKWENLPGGFK